MPYICKNIIFWDVKLLYSFRILSQAEGQEKWSDKINEADIKLCMKIRIINMLCLTEDLN